MSRSQSIIDKLISFMQADAKFNEIKRYITSPKDLFLNTFPCCVVLIDEDNIERLGHRNKHELVLLFSFTFLDYTQEGNRYSYEMADALEDLINVNHKFTMESGEMISCHLTKKAYSLDFENETQVMDGVECEVTINYLAGPVG